MYSTLEMLRNESKKSRANYLYLLFNVDAFERLKKRRAKSIHAIVTDPPYAINEYTAD